VGHDPPAPDGLRRDRHGKGPRDTG
jgi:hypothetical protein